MCDVSKIKVLNESHPVTTSPSLSISQYKRRLVDAIDAEYEHIQHHYHRRKTKPSVKESTTVHNLKVVCLVGDFICCECEILRYSQVYHLSLSHTLI
jgi:hypothetical protein